MSVVVRAGSSIYELLFTTNLVKTRYDVLISLRGAGMWILLPLLPSRRLAVSLYLQPLKGKSTSFTHSNVFTLDR